MIMTGFIIAALSSPLAQVFGDSAIIWGYIVGILVGFIAHD